MTNNSSHPAGRVQRFVSSKAFYPVALGVVFALCVCIWLIGKPHTDRSVAVTSAITTQVAATVPSVPDTRQSETTTSTTAPVTHPYDNNRAGEGDWSLPLKSGRVLKGYSNGTLVKSTTMGDYRVHDAVDFTCHKGDPVLAVNSGVVTDSYNDAFWGTVLVVNHGGGVVAKYCGLNPKLSVGKGDEVKKGDTLGVVGVIPCESADGIHLHLEVSVNKELADPLFCLNKENVKE